MNYIILYILSEITVNMFEILCLINCFRIDSLSSNLRDKTTHLSMQHCFHVVFCIIGTQYLHIGNLEKKISPSELVSNGYISNHNKYDAHAQIQSLFLFIFLLFLNQCYSNKL